jgi:hypothetical protein
MNDDNVNDNGLNWDVELDFGNLEFEEEFLSDNKDRYHNPKPYKGIKDKFVKYSHATRAANYIEIGDGSRSHMVTAGSFEFGDFIEALLKERNAQVKHMSVSTLSMSQNNIDSFANLLHDGWVDKLDLIVSDYFYAHERKALVPYMMHELDHENRFQLAVAGSHTKIAIFETYGGKKIVMHGSANLRSSGCLEQTCIEENAELFDFYMDFHNAILEEYSVINKPIRHKKLWQAVQNNMQATTPTDPKDVPQDLDGEEQSPSPPAVNPKPHSKR